MWQLCSSLIAVKAADRLSVDGVLENAYYMVGIQKFAVDNAVV